MGEDHLDHFGRRLVRDDARRPRAIQQSRPARLPGCAVTVKPDGTGFPGLAGRRFDLVINATSAGLSNAVLPLPTSVFAPRCVAYEMVYGRETAFMAQARDAGARTADGLGMLVEQAAEAFFVWRGIRPHTAPVLAALKQA